MPPEALTPRASPTVARMSATAWVDAPPAGWKPVDVLTKSAPAAIDARQAATISSSVRAAASIMTLRTRGEGTTRRTAAISPSKSASRPSLTSSMLMTMSISSAPSATARAASKAFTSGLTAPEGKPTTQATLSPSGTSRGSMEGETHTEKVPAPAPSSTMRATSARVASGLRIVWSIIAATSRFFMRRRSPNLTGLPAAGRVPSSS